jgi:hypothetical protein
MIVILIYVKFPDVEIGCIIFGVERDDSPRLLAALTAQLQETSRNDGDFF